MTFHALWRADSLRTPPHGVVGSPNPFWVSNCLASILTEQTVCSPSCWAVSILHVLPVLVFYSFCLLERCIFQWGQKLGEPCFEPLAPCRWAAKIPGFHPGSPRSNSWASNHRSRLALSKIIGAETRDFKVKQVIPNCWLETSESLSLSMRTCFHSLLCSLSKNRRFQSRSTQWRSPSSGFSLSSLPLSCSVKLHPQHVPTFINIVSKVLGAVAHLPPPTTNRSLLHPHFIPWPHCLLMYVSQAARHHKHFLSLIFFSVISFPTLLKKQDFFFT